MAAALRARAGVGRVVRRLPLRVLLGLHPPVLEPDLDLALREVQVAGQLPPATGAIRHAAQLLLGQTQAGNGTSVCPISKKIIENDCLLSFEVIFLQSNCFIVIVAFFVHCCNGSFARLVIKLQIIMKSMALNLHLIKNKRGKNSPSHGTDFTFSVWKRRR